MISPRFYIHTFPGSLWPPTISRREISGKAAAINFIPQPFLIAFFNFSHKWPTFAFTGESGYSLAFANRTAHNGPHVETGAFRTGRYHYPRSVPHVRKPPRVGYQNGVRCRFWVLVGSAPEERRKPSEQRCAYARRCSEASRPRWAA